MKQPLIIAHRGASGYRPEHTLAGYELAARMGADYLEPDLVPTADGVLVARHENEISGTTDIADRAEFADYRTKKVIDGTEVVGWFTEDLTWAQVQTLRAIERIPHLRPANTDFNRLYAVPRLEEILKLRERLSGELDREIGVYPETKHPTYFAGLGLALEEPLMAVINKTGLNSSDAPIFVQSFDVGNLRKLRRDLGCRARLVFLADADDDPAEGPANKTYAEWLTTAGLTELARDVDAIGPHKDLVLYPMPGLPSLVERAQLVGLMVHPWTCRAENAFLAPVWRSSNITGEHGDVKAEVTSLLDLGVDGVFSDHSDLAVAARDAWLRVRG
ncbi:glycerophosphodiester phosphodiesterase [Ornithinimicrobium sp. Arc0846-15]|nr:glycerophosphodiester phosphodiesterase [Ornithinimicrobium laminariae]